MDIEAYRLRKKKSVAELAGMLGVKPAAIYNYKYGKSLPSYEAIEKMLLDGAYISEIFSEEVQEKVSESLGSREPERIRFTEEEVGEFLARAAEIFRKKKGV